MGVIEGHTLPLRETDAALQKNAEVSPSRGILECAIGVLLLKGIALGTILLYP